MRSQWLYEDNLWTRQLAVCRRLWLYEEMHVDGTGMIAQAGHSARLSAVSMRRRDMLPSQPFDPSVAHGEGARHRVPQTT